MTAAINFFEIPLIKLLFEQSQIRQPQNETCSCNACDSFCLPQSTSTTTGQPSSTTTPVTTSATREQAYQTDTDDEEFPDLPLSNMFFDIGLQAKSCITQSPKYNCTIIKACNIQLLGILSQSELPDLCFGANGNLTLVPASSDPLSGLILELNPIAFFPSGEDECRCPLCDGICVDNPVSPAVSSK